MSFQTDLRIKKNIMVKNIYYLLNLEGFFIIFHNNKNFTKFKNKILFQNKLKCFVVNNTFFLNIVNKKQDKLFLNLFVGPSGFIFIDNQENLFKFFDFFFSLNASERLDFLLLGIYWRFKNRFLSLEHVFDILSTLKHFKSISEFLVDSYITILQRFNNPFFLLINLLNNFTCNFLICLSLLENNRKEKN